MSRFVGSFPPIKKARKNGPERSRPKGFAYFYKLGSITTLQLAGGGIVIVVTANRGPASSR